MKVVAPQYNLVGGENRQYEPWLDVARFVAMLFVVVSHAGDTFNFNTPADGAEAYAFWGQFWGSLSRFCVPVFAMMTGYLLLPVRSDWLSFEKKRIGRIMPPFLFWSVAYCMMPFVMGLLGGSLTELKWFLPIADSPACDWASSFSALVRIPLNFTLLTNHLWYVYMLIGLYLILPVFSPWFERTSTRGKCGFLALWTASLTLPYIRQYLGPAFGECDWNQFGIFYSFGGFLGYALLGSVLGHMHALSWRLTLGIALPLFTAGFLVTVFGFHRAYIATGGEYNAETGPMLELYWTFLSPNVAAMSAAVFIMAKKFTRLPKPIVTALQSINTCGFSIYCAHYAFIGGIYHFVIRPLDLPVAIQLPVLAIISYLTVWAFVGMLRKIPAFRSFV